MTLTKMVYRFHACSFKVIIAFLILLGKVIVEFIWNRRDPELAKAFLSNKSKAGIIILELRFYHKAAVIKNSMILSKHQTGSVEKKVG